MKRFVFALLLTSTTALWAVDPPGVAHLSADTLKAFEKSLAQKLDAHKSATQMMGQFGNHSLLLAYREGDGEAEFHENQADVFVIQSGEATLLVGGQVQEGRTTAPGEIRGRAVSGGERKKLVAGDVVHIPAKVPHQVLVAPGTKVTYLVVKVDAR